MSNPYRTADTPETIPAQNSSKFPLDIEASEHDDVHDFVHQHLSLALG